MLHSDRNDGASALAGPRALRAGLEFAIKVDVNLLVVEGKTTKYLSAFELRSAVVPNEVL